MARIKRKCGASVANLKRVGFVLVVVGFCVMLLLLFHTNRVPLETVTAYAISLKPRVFSDFGLNSSNQTTAAPKKVKLPELLNNTNHSGISSNALEMLTWFSQNSEWRDLEYSADCDTGTFAPMRSPSTGLPLLTAYFCTSFDSGTAVWCYLGPCFDDYCAPKSVKKAVATTRFICAFNDGMAVMSEPITGVRQIIVVCKLNSEINSALYSEPQFQHWLDSSSGRILASDSRTRVGVRLVDARQWTRNKQTPDEYMSATVPVCATFGINHGIYGVPHFQRSDWPKGTPKPAPKHLVGGCAIVHPLAGESGTAHILAGQWLHYHTTVARLDHVYLYHHWSNEQEANGSHAEGHRAIVDAAQRHISQIGNATYIRWKVQTSAVCTHRALRCWQQSQYHSCARHFRFDTRYFIIFDIDEFVVANAKVQLTSAQLTAATFSQRANVRKVIERMLAEKDFGYATMKRFLGSRCDANANRSSVNDTENIPATFLERHACLCMIQPLGKYILEGGSMVEMKTHSGKTSNAAFGGFGKKGSWQQNVASSALIIVHASERHLCDGKQANEHNVEFIQSTAHLFNEVWQEYVATNTPLSLSVFPQVAD